MQKKFVTIQLYLPPETIDHLYKLAGQHHTDLNGAVEIALREVLSIEARKEIASGVTLVLDDGEVMTIREELDRR
mgnify:CR=1 FL=1